jgi:hypothetical protein
MNKHVKSRAIELYTTGITNKSEIARIIAKELNSDDFTSIRLASSRAINKKFGRKVDNGIREASQSVEVDYKNVPYLWLKTKEASLFVKNPTFEAKEIDFDKVISECMSDYKPIKKNEFTLKKSGKTFDRLVWTDVHVGMDASRGGLALYPVDWNEDMLMQRVVEMANFVLSKKSSDLLIIDELGDYMDGWDGETVRKGHKLPQNMTNEESFDCGLKAKLYLTQLLAPHYNEIVVNNICEDNHSGAFGYVLNSAFKNVVDCLYKNVEVNNYKKFINWYKVGDHVFVITHGKDSRNLKFGFRPQLTPQSIEKIDQFLKYNSLYSEGKYITFCKGDSHQALLDMCSSDDFYYFNYMAFSPSSEWVQTNFKKGRSGFQFEVYEYHTNNRSLHPYYFSN